VKLLTVSLMMSCNRACYYCPVKRWLVPLEGSRERGRNLITNAALLKWLEKFIDPSEWIIEITGGEPGLYYEIQTLIPELASRGYRGIIKTNGTLPIPKSEAFSLVACWHKGADFPVYYNQIVIIENPSDDWKQKVQYCEDNGIPCQTAQFDRWFEKVIAVTSNNEANKMLSVLHVSSSGKVTRCSKRPSPVEMTIFNMLRPLPHELPDACPKCKNVYDVEKFLPADLREQLEKDYEAHIQAKTAAAEASRRLTELNSPEALARAEIYPEYAAEREAELAALS